MNTAPTNDSCLLTVQCDWPEVQTLPALTSSRLGDIPVEEIDAVMVSRDTVLCLPMHSELVARFMFFFYYLCIAEC